MLKQLPEKQPLAGWQYKRKGGMPLERISDKNWWKCNNNDKNI
ncbi:MAG: hypothetical protein ACPLGZ_00050 [Candidatus Pelagibacter ubique]